jgi:hypothetical protein
MHCPTVEVLAQTRRARERDDVVVKEVYLYCFKNLVNGEEYVGQCQDVGARLASHIRKPCKSMKAETPMSWMFFDVFSHEVLVGPVGPKRTNDMEECLIRERNCLFPHSYNIVRGNPMFLKRFLAMKYR